MFKDPSDQILAYFPPKSQVPYPMMHPQGAHPIGQLIFKMYMPIPKLSCLTKDMSSIPLNITAT